MAEWLFVTFNYFIKLILKLQFMSKFINIVTIKIKKELKRDYIKKIKNITNFEGLISSKHIIIDSSTYLVIEEWSSKEALMKARKTIEAFDKMSNFANLIKENSPEIDVITSFGGTIVNEQNITKNKTEYPESSYLDSERIGNKHFYFLYSNS